MKKVVFTLIERPQSTVEQLRNGKYLVYVNIEEKDEVIEHQSDIEGERVDGEPTTQHVFLCEAVEVPTLNYSAIVTAIVRSRYSADEVEAILLNGSDTDEHESELAALQQWRKQAKDIARSITNE